MGTFYAGKLGQLRKVYIECSGGSPTLFRWECVVVLAITATVVPWQCGNIASGNSSQCIAPMANPKLGTATVLRPKTTNLNPES